MPVPTYDQFIEPLLRHLAAHSDGAAIADAHEALAIAMKLTPEDRAEMLSSGAQAVFKNRIGWAHDRLKRAGLSSSPRRGFWKLTHEGQAFAIKHRGLPENELERLASVDRTSRLKPKKDAPAETPSAPTLPATRTEKVSPEERIEAALAEVRDSVARDLLENMGRAPPEFFEQLVLDLLHAMVYGTDRSDLQRVGGSGNGGIDGIISLDRLGLEKVYIQAKRWKEHCRQAPRSKASWARSNCRAPPRACSSRRARSPRTRARRRRRRAGALCSSTGTSNAAAERGGRHSERPRTSSSPSLTSRKSATMSDPPEFRFHRREA